jgi:hypothetical protein
VTEKDPSLAVGRLDLIPEWDEERNGLATEVTCGSGKKVWRVCNQCGVSWQSRIVTRAVNGFNLTPKCQELSREEPRKLLLKDRRP